MGRIPYPGAALAVQGRPASACSGLRKCQRSHRHRTGTTGTLPGPARARCNEGGEESATFDRTPSGEGESGGASGFLVGGEVYPERDDPDRKATKQGHFLAIPLQIATLAASALLPFNENLAPILAAPVVVPPNDPTHLPGGAL
jgi:hypothetical protein